MKEKALNNFTKEKNLVINISQNEYVFLDNKIYNNSILGFFTDSIVTCSLLLISINDDDFIFFSHIDECSNIAEIIKIKIIPILSKIKINNLCVIYTEGIGSIKNIKKNFLIKEVIDIIDEIFISEKKVYRHSDSTSCLKFIKNSSNQIATLMNKIICYEISIMNETSKKFKINIENNKSLLEKVYSKKKKLFFILIPIQWIKFRKNLILL